MEYNVYIIYNIDTIHIALLCKAHTWKEHISCVENLANDSHMCTMVCYVPLLENIQHLSLRRDSKMCKVTKRFKLVIHKWIQLSN